MNDRPFVFLLFFHFFQNVPQFLQCLNLHLLLGQSRRNDNARLNLGFRLDSGYLYKISITHVFKENFRHRVYLSPLKNLLFLGKPKGASLPTWARCPNQLNKSVSVLVPPARL